MIRRCVFSVAAQNDLESIGDYLAKYDPRQAELFINGLIDQCEAIPRMPEAWPARPELRQGLRAMTYGKYVSFYTVTSDAVIIKRIVHGARDLTRIF